ncbi:hypothetical protein GCM10017557_00130 [Streptomyces aurantiacus]|uniref:Uncharacterized protein n=1 Tax=Streptomyces aurantiacus TaxID=47760 RepID=A0A7G1NU42_9ACTN|nr:hypothetical protein GCM10017557_00130 [Streptomyces aurantiacus]
MKTATVPEPRTAATLAARRRKTEISLERVHEAITRLRRETAQISVTTPPWQRPKTTAPGCSPTRTTNAKRPGANAH